MNEEIESKKKEIVEYEAIVERYRLKYGQGRWYHNGVDRLAELRAELRVLEAK